MNILILNGPNLNLLGEREPEVYGSESLEDVNNWLVEHPDNRMHECRFFQSNHEGALIDEMQGQRHWADGFVINPGGLTHTSVSLRDAVAGCQVPTVEVHLSDIHAREEFRKISMLKDVCIAQIAGQGKQGYLQAITLLEKKIKKHASY